MWCEISKRNVSKCELAASATAKGAAGVGREEERQAVDGHRPPAEMMH